MIRLTSGVLVGLLCTTGVAYAGKINMPKEGSFQLQLCAVGNATPILANDQVYITHYSSTALLSSTLAGGPFDRQTARCWGTLGTGKMRPSHTGYCEMVDADGDKWWMDVKAKDDNTGGTYTAIAGTGKYDGMSLTGEYKVDFYPFLGGENYTHCNPNKGTYKLK
jgi:hypothetical protein